ncbi:MAG: methylmalonyl Co-A mutase-associated GTPase MeaB [Bacteroidetes bacterium]|nr:methylmalonyl Co-A mutase-associated GTPase MeaB [Bacteroidota bacterium]
MRPLPSIDQLVQGILAGELVALSRAITLVESQLEAHADLAYELLGRLMPHAGGSVRLGITGVPGVGKSTFIEAFGLHLAEDRGLRVAVLAIDPSSQRTGGAILGDKTRMELLSQHPRVFIRPSAASDYLGGTHRKTRETLLLCEAAGYDVVIIETVGVGQSETAVSGMVDFFLLLMLAGAGDELQGIKRGIMEMADALLITKADGDNQAAARKAKAEYEAALHLFPPTASGWQPRVAMCSALTRQGIPEAWELVQAYLQHVKANGYHARNRQLQLRQWFREGFSEDVLHWLAGSSVLGPVLEQLEQQVLRLELHPQQAVRRAIARLQQGWTT